VEIKELNCWSIPSLPVKIRELLVTLVTPYSVLPVDETFLLDPRITENPVAISIEDLKLYSLTPVRAVIIERQKKTSGDVLGLKSISSKAGEKK